MALNIRIEKKSLEEHVDRICRKNLKDKRIKLCGETCPFLHYVMDIMREKGYYYLEKYEDY